MRLYFSNYLHGLDGAKRSEQLPQYVLLRFGSQIVDEDAPTRCIDRVTRQHCVSQQIIASQWRVPAVNIEIS